MSGYHVTLTVFPDDQADLSRSCEVVSRAMAGLAMEGLTASLTVAELEEETHE